MKQDTTIPIAKERTGVIPTTWAMLAAGAAVIILLTTFAYLPAMRGEFVWDDDSWTTNVLWLVRDVHGLFEMWFNPTALQQYYPLAGTSFWIDYHLWGFSTLPYHIENLVLHIAAALLFWGILRRLRVPGAWLAGAIFAIHPIMVESVAWITERKNVLSMVLYLSGFWAYGRFARYWNDADESIPAFDAADWQRWAAYALAFVLFAAALLAKSTAFSFPAVILLICWWKRGRIGWADIGPTIPFFVVSIGFSMGTSYLEKNHVGAIGPDWDLSFLQRCLIAGHVVWFYIAKLLWPAMLCFTYPRWHLNTGSLLQWFYPISAVIVLLALWLARGRIGRGPITAALFYVGTLFPVLGFMNAYYMTYSYVCDHWSYQSSLGLIALAAALLARLAARFRVPAALYGFAPIPLGIFAFLTWQQCHIYTDLTALWTDTLAKNPNAWLAHNNLGMIQQDNGDLPDAIANYEATIQLDPNFPQSYNNLGTALKDAGDIQGAIVQYNKALQLRPDYAHAHTNLGNAYRAQHKFKEAVEQFNLALYYQPDSPDAHYNLANTLRNLGDYNGAIEHYNRAIQLEPDYFEAHANFGVLLLGLGRPEEAAVQFQQMVRIDPDSPDAHNNLAIALWQGGDAHDAIIEWNSALQLRPDYPDALNGLAEALAKLPPADGGDPAHAIAFAEQACSLVHYRVARFNDTLATAYAAAGRFSDAVPMAQKAIDLAKAAGDTQFAAQIQARLQLYQSGHLNPPPTTQSTTSP
jgi:protein O-mannosyl-transferase